MPNEAMETTASSPDVARAVVVTGASSGIGEACALRLARQGFRVFAGVRSHVRGSEVERRGGRHVTPVHIDITDAASLAAARDAVAAATGAGGLYGLVNNAGIAVGGALEFVPLEQLRRQLEVNVVGTLAATQAFLPLVRQAKGRIINIGSQAGIVATPFLAPYSASKFALEALTDCLRIELLPWGIAVSLVEPAVIDTPIWQKSLSSNEEILASLPAQVYELYGPAIESMRTRVRSIRGLPPERVAEAVAHALLATHPRTRYPVGADARLRRFLARLPDQLRDRIILRNMPFWKRA